MRHFDEITKLGQENDALVPTFLQYVFVVWLVPHFADDCIFANLLHSAVAGQVK